jgi:hypothetical protein
MKTSTFPLHVGPFRSRFPSLVPRLSSLFPHIIFSIFLFSCNSTQKQNQLPIPQEQMVNIMVDMHLAETAANMKLTATDSTRPSYDRLVEVIFEKYGTTQTTFDSALYVLSFRPAEMNKVYDLVLERLSQMDAEVKAKQE